MAYQYSEQLNIVSKDRYKENLAIANLEQCPYQLPEGIWSSDVKTWPNVTDLVTISLNTYGILPPKAATVCYGRRPQHS